MSCEGTEMVQGPHDAWMPGAPLSMPGRPSAAVADPRRSARTLFRSGRLRLPQLHLLHHSTEETR